ncbi:MAG: hypothetical protein JNJ88_16430 [Planctomycetes bacterium]|nr:hypothetical protein [Planctomycetota bacterium]
MMEPTAEQRTRTDRLVLLLAAICVLFSAVVAVRLVLATRTGTVDSYYYYARAAQLAEGVPLRETTINWGEGVDRKFFPGYPLMLRPFMLGTPPERAWRTLSVVLALVNPILIGFALRRLGLSFRAACLAVAMFATSFVPLNWTSMPMAEGSAVLWLCFSALMLPTREEGAIRSAWRFLAACLLGGMAIQCRAEAAYPAAALGLVGIARIRGKSGWLAVGAMGAILGAAPFFYWVSSLPSTGESGSRLHYVNEFFREFSWFDREDSSGKGGVLGNFGRSWWHPVFCWGRTPFAETPDEDPIQKAFWISVLVGWMAVAIGGFGGSRARIFALSYIGFVAFRSFWYYPYERFLITGLPMAFAAAAIITDVAWSKSKWAGWLCWAFALIWVARGAESISRFHKVRRHAENGTHSMRDDDELARLRMQLGFTTFPLEGPDFTVLAGRRYVRRLPAASLSDPQQRREALEKEVVVLEFPWPQACYAMRPRPVILGWPLENFWGAAEYTGKYETVPKNPDGTPVRTPRRTVDFLKDRGARYVITARPRTEFEGTDGFERSFKGFLEFAGITPDEGRLVRHFDTIEERRSADTMLVLRYEWPRRVHVHELRLGLLDQIRAERAQSSPASEPAKK